MITLEPNPYSPFATADPQARHLFATIMLFGAPIPNVLAPTACEELAVVPAEELKDLPDGPEEPAGLCGLCLAAARGGVVPERGEAVECAECASLTRHAALCALCRQEAHDEWVEAGRPTLADPAVTEVLRRAFVSAENLADGLAPLASPRPHESRGDAGATSPA